MATPKSTKGWDKSNIGACLPRIDQVIDAFTARLLNGEPLIAPGDPGDATVGGVNLQDLAREVSASGIPDPIDIGPFMGESVPLDHLEAVLGDGCGDGWDRRSGGVERLVAQGGTAVAEAVARGRLGTILSNLDSEDVDGSVATARIWGRSRWVRWLEAHLADGPVYKFAKHVGVSAGTAGRWMRGETVPLARSFSAIADAAGLTVREVSALIALHTPPLLIQPQDSGGGVDDPGSWLARVPRSWEGWIAPDLGQVSPPPEAVDKVEMPLGFWWVRDGLGRWEPTGWSLEAEQVSAVLHGGDRAHPAVELVHDAVADGMDLADPYVAAALTEWTVWLTQPPGRGSTPKGPYPTRPLEPGYRLVMDRFPLVLRRWLSTKNPPAPVLEFATRHNFTPGLDVHPSRPWALRRERVRWDEPDHCISAVLAPDTPTEYRQLALRSLDRRHWRRLISNRATLTAVLNVPEVPRGMLLWLAANLRSPQILKPEIIGQFQTAGLTTKELLYSTYGREELGYLNERHQIFDEVLGSPTTWGRFPDDVSPQECALAMIWAETVGVDTRANRSTRFSVRSRMDEWVEATGLRAFAAEHLWGHLDGGAPPLTYARSLVLASAVEMGSETRHRFLLVTRLGRVASTIYGLPAVSDIAHAVRSLMAVVGSTDAHIEERFGVDPRLVPWLRHYFESSVDDRRDRILSVTMPKGPVAAWVRNWFPEPAGNPPELA